MPNKSPSNLPISAVDLFCGAGGLTYGLTRGGVRVKAGFDIDPNSSYPYTTNNDAKFILKDITEISAKDILPHFDIDTYKLLAGCAPCQPFSTYSRSHHPKSSNKWQLLKEFQRIISEVEPDFITMENVPQLSNHQIFDEFTDSLHNYFIWKGLVDGPQYGIPQRRKRLVLIASKLGSISFVKPTHNESSYKTVRDVIDNLPKLNAGETSPRDALHTSSNLSKLNLERIKQSVPGGTWRDWDQHLVANCHRKKTGNTFPSVYGRMEWDKPAPTVTTQCFGYGNGRFGHPEQDRAISLREAAIFQTFPNDYKFTPLDKKPKFNITGRLIGNAVPVKLGEVIARSFREHLLMVATS